MISKKPILFSAPMVQAIKDGRKTMTRRVIKSSHKSGLYRISKAQKEYNESGYYHGIMPESLDWDERSVSNIVCPYGRIEDILWVREEHYRYGHWEPVPNTLTPTGRQKWAFVPDTKEVRYFDNPPAEYRKGRHHKDPETPAWHKRLARYMYYNDCRLFLKVTDIRVERLQDISEEDAIAEGCWLDHSVLPNGYTVAGMPHWLTAKECFQELWESINGPGSFKRNEWVWVVSFERTTKPE